MEEPDLMEVFKKQGSKWSTSEIRACIGWLFKRKQWKELAAIMIRHLGPSATAEDVKDFWSSFVADSLERVIHSYDPDRGSSFKSYFSLCLKRECWKRKTRLQKIRAYEQPLAELPENGLPLADEDEHGILERRDRLQKALDRIEPRHAAALKDYYFHGKSVLEIAEERGVRPGTVKSWLHRGRDEMHAELERLDCQKQRG